MSTTLGDPAAEATLARDGVVTFPLLDAEQVEALRELYRAHRPAAGEGFATDLERASEAERRAVTAAVAPIVGPPLAAALPGQRAFMVSYLMKWPGEGSELAMHQDWSYVDERAHRTVAVWIALDPASPELDNGPLEVLRGSHLLAHANRGTGTRPWYEPLAPALEAAMEPVAVRAGDVVVMDNRLLHRSPPNRTDRPRLALALAMGPQGAPLEHPVAEGDGTVRVLAVDEDFLVSSSPQGLQEAPPEGEVVRWAPVLVRPPTGADLRRCGVAVTDAEVDAATRGLPGQLGASEPPEPVSGLLAGSVVRLLRANHPHVAAAAGADGPLADPGDLPWLADLEAAWPAIRAEWDGAGSLLPRMSDITGSPLPTRGVWGGLVLRDNAGWVGSGTARFPRTTAVLRRVPGLRAALFSSLDPGAEITPHRGVNNGVLRVHLGIDVPGPPGAAALQVGPEWVPYAEGRAFAFDDTWEHRAVNRAAEPRISLMIEVDRPLPGALGLRNRLVQPAFRLNPQVRGGRRRFEQLDRALNG